MTVFVLWGENCFSENGEVAWVEGIFATKEGATAAKTAAEEAVKAEGLTVCYPEIEYDEDDERDEDDWDRSFNIEEHEVQS